MIRHIVVWKLKDFAEGHSKKENMEIMKKKIEGLADKIEGVVKLEVGFNIHENEYDLCLVSTFESKEALEFYDQHPLHQEVRKFVRAVRNERAVADYEIEN